MRHGVIVAMSVVAFGLLAACGPAAVGGTPQAGLANPASVYCEQNGGKLELRTGAGGGVVGICLYPDGSECEEWTYFRGECKPGQSLSVTEPAPLESPEQVVAADITRKTNDTSR